MAIAQSRLEKRHDVLAALLGQFEAVERGRQHFGRCRFEIEQQENRFRQIEVRKVSKDETVGATVEQAWQYRPPQQLLAALRLEIEHRA